MALNRFVRWIVAAALLAVGAAHAATPALYVA